VLECYRVTARFPKEEMYGLTSQVRRAAVSIPANIAEGRGRHHSGDFTHHLSIAHGSLAELETLFEISTRVGYLDSQLNEELLKHTAEIGRMLNGLRRSIQSGQHPGR
jgi:four helix bundle protein